MGLTTAMVDALLSPINPNRVKRNRDGKSHVEAYDIRRRLTSIFGFAGWSGEVLACDLVFEEDRLVGKQKDQPGVAVCYKVLYRLTVNDPETGEPMAVYTEAASGDGVMGVASRSDAHDFAIKTAESQALKRAATNLGDQFGLSLYNKGSLEPLIQYVLGRFPAKLTVDGIIRPRAAGGDQGNEDVQTTDEHITSQLASEDEDPAPAQEADADVEVSTPPATDTPPGQAADHENVPALVADIRERALAATKRREVAALITEATKEKVTGAMTTDETGRGMTLETFLMGRVKQLGNAA